MFGRLVAFIYLKSICCAQITFSCLNSYFSYSLHSTPVTDHLPGEGPQLSEPTGLFVLKPESVTATKGLAKIIGHKN